MKIVSKGFVDGYYYKPRVDMEVLQQYHSGIIALSACLAGEVQRYLVKGLYDEAKKVAKKYENCFGKGNFFLELQDHGIPEQQMVNPQLVRRQALNWLRQTTYITPTRKMRRHTISCSVSRPERNCPMRTVCATRAASIM